MSCGARSLDIVTHGRDRCTVTLVGDRDEAAVAPSVVAIYRDALGRHLRAPGETGLGDAYELGRMALNQGTTLLQLVQAHLEARRALAVVPVTERLDNADRFLSEALAAYEVAQRGYAEVQRAAHAERVRAALLNDLTSAYLAVASHVTSTDRCDETVRQVERLLGAVDARVELGRARSHELPTDGEVLVAPLPGGSGRLVAIGALGRHWSEPEHAVLQQLAVLVHAPIVDARLLEFSERLERIGALLGGELDPEAIVARLLDEGLDQTAAAFAAIWVLDIGTLRLAGASSDDPPPVSEAVCLEEPSPFATVARSGAPLFLPDEAAIKEFVANHGLLLPHPSTKAWAIVPLEGRSGLVGVVDVRFDDPQSFDPAQRLFLAHVGERLATALERGGAFSAERDARREAELATERVSDMHELATELSHATTRRGVAGALLRHATRVTGAVSGMVAMLDRRTDDVELLAMVGPGGGGGRHVLEVPPDAVGVVAASSIYEGSLEQAPLPVVIVERLRSEQIAGVATYPLMIGSRQVGGVLLGWSERTVPAFDRDELRAALAMTGPALRRAGRYDLDHDIAVTLQRSLLTVPTVEVPGIAWSAGYRSGSPGVAGGDWYDVIALGDRRVAVVIGDIVGKGVQAAATGGQLRSATRALVNRVDDPGRLVEALDDYVRSTGQGLFSSLAFVVIDADERTARHSIAGHPPPLLCTPDKQTTVIETGRGPLLGVDADRTVATLRLEPGDLIVLYTDGLIERRGRSLRDGLDVLIDTVRSAIMEPSQLCRYVMDALGDDSASDDIAIVAVQLARE